MLIVSTTKTVRRYIDRSYSWLRKKRGGQNRTAQWSRKGKSKNLDSKIFLFHNSTVFVFESLEEVSKASKHYWNSTCIRTLFTSEVLSQLNLIDWSTSKKAFSVLNHCALCRQAKTEIRRRLTSIWFDHSMVNATLNKVVEYMTTIGRLWCNESNSTMNNIPSFKVPFYFVEVTCLHKPLCCGNLCHQFQNLI